MTPSPITSVAVTAPEETVTIPRADLARIIEVSARAAAGDLEARVTQLTPGTEWSKLGHALNALLDVADAYVREAAAAMDHCSKDQFHRPILERGLHGAYAQSARTINRAGIKMRDSSRQIGFLAGLADQNAHTVQTVAAACEELTATSTDISRQVAQVSERSAQNAREATRAREAMNQLGHAAGKINAIVALIGKVTGQTNLLALNATIEAARAGEHGKGFAVVATEVKELSRNTGKAATEISQEVAAVQQQVREVTEIIGGISSTINGMAEGAQQITAAVQEQTKATAEISRSINEVSENSRKVSESMSRHRQESAGHRAA